MCIRDSDKNLKAEEDDLINDEEAVRSIYHLFKLSDPDIRCV